MRVRKIKEDLALRDLAKVMIRVNEQEALKDQAVRLLSDEMNTFESRYRDEFAIDLFQMYDLYLERLNSEADTARARLEEIRPELEKERAKLLEARRNLRIVEILKENYRKRYDYELRRHEKKQMDEANMRRGEKKITEYRHEFARPDGSSEEQYLEEDTLDTEFPPAEKQKGDIVSEFLDSLKKGRKS